MEESQLKPVIFDPWKQPQAILTLFNQKAEILSSSLKESLIVSRIKRQLEHFSRATPNVYRNAELMGLVVWYNYVSLTKNQSSYSYLSPLMNMLKLVYEQLPNKVSVEYFYNRDEGQHQCGKEISIPKFLHFQCEALTTQLIDIECRTTVSDNELQMLIDHMTLGLLPLRVNSIVPESSRSESIRVDILKNCHALICRGSELFKNTLTYVNLQKSDISLAIDFVASKYPQHYKKGGPEAALIGMHLALLKALLQPKLLTSKIESSDIIELMSSFNCIYQFLNQNNLSLLLSQEYFEVDSYKNLLKFQFLSRLEIEAVSNRKEFNYLIPDSKEYADRFKQEDDHVSINLKTLQCFDSMLSNFLSKTSGKNPLKDLICTVIMVQNFQRRFDEVRKSVPYDALAWPIARITAIMVSLIDDKKKGIEANNEIIDRLLSFINSINDFRYNNSYVTQRNDPKLKQNMTLLLDEKAVALYCKINDYWHGQWDNNEPIDFNQIKQVTEKLVLAVITKSDADRDELIKEMETILHNRVILKQKDSHKCLSVQSKLF